MKRTLSRILPFIALTLMIPGGAVGSQQGVPLSPAITAAMDSIFLPMSHSGEPGCAAGIYQNGAVTFERGYGFANLTHTVPITTTTRFTTGSVSKQFTAASIALLVTAGRISLDDDVRKYIPEMTAYPTPVKVRHLVHHTSGLRDFWQLVGLSGLRYDDGYTNDDMLAMAARQRNLNFVPGSEYRYSNTGYLAMAIIVKRVTGQTLRQFADSAIFRPLGMHHSLFLDDHNEIVPDRAAAYSPKGRGWEVNIWNNDIVGQGGLVTTIEDLQRWDENFYSGKVGGRAFIDLMQTTEPLTGGAPNIYAFGLNVTTYRGQRFVEHSGSTGGYRAIIARFPDQHTSFAMLCNRSSVNTTQLALRMADVVLASALGPATPRATPAGQEEGAAHRIGAARPREAAAIVGRYASPELGGAVWEVVADASTGGALQLRRPRAANEPLAPLEGALAYSVGDGSTLTFDAPARGRSGGFRLDWNRVSNIRFDRVLP
ncbi:MAG: serine hydrolase domain-containing protein [Gemmatimonadota bacterium]